MHKLSRPKDKYYVINLNVKLSLINVGKMSKVRGRISQGANKPEGEQARGERARQQTSQGANESGGYMAMRRKSQTPRSVFISISKALRKQ